MQPVNPEPLNHEPMNVEMVNRKQESQLPKQESAANLRRLDWRFLLPSPKAGRFRHLLLFGGPKGLAERIVEANLAEKVSCEISEGCRADAAILLYDSIVTLEQVAKHLGDGGVLYQELARTSLSSWRMTPNRLRRRLHQAGLTLTGLYWAAPDFEKCRRYIPLDATSAVLWYFSSLFVAGTPAHQAIRTLFMRATGTKGHWLSWLVPNLSITAVVGASTPHAPSLLADPHIASILSKDDLRPMLLTSGQDDASRVILLPFASQGAPRPEAVIKIATNAKFNVETELEQRVLREVRSCLDEKMCEGVPKPLGNFQYGALAVGVESCAPGASMWASSGAWGASTPTKIEDVELGARWLTEFHRQTATRCLPWDRQAIECWIDHPIAAYTKSRAVTEAEQRLFAAMRAHAHRLLGAELPLAWQHNDFAPWNLFRAGEQLTVIDWEFNRNWDTTRAGPVLCDLLYFVTYWNNVAQHLYTVEAELAGMRALYFASGSKSDSKSVGTNQYTLASRRAIAHYMTALNVDSRFLPLLLVYTWLERVVYSYTRAEKLGHDPATSRSVDKFVKYIALLADHSEELFAATGEAFWHMYAANGSAWAAESPAPEVLG